MKTKKSLVLLLANKTSHRVETDDNGSGVANGDCMSILWPIEFWVRKPFIFSVYTQIKSRWFIKRNTVIGKTGRKRKAAESWNSRFPPDCCNWNSSVRPTRSLVKRHVMLRARLKVIQWDNSAFIYTWIHFSSQNFIYHHCKWVIILLLWHLAINSPNYLSFAYSRSRNSPIVLQIACENSEETGTSPILWMEQNFCFVLFKWVIPLPSKK
jgi:hypothetical protein